MLLDGRAYPFRQARARFNLSFDPGEDPAAETREDLMEVAGARVGGVEDGEQDRNCGRHYGSRGETT